MKLAKGKRLPKIVSENLLLLFYILTSSIIIGWTVAFFLKSLDIATEWREHFSFLILGLPFAGIFIFWIYKKFGKGSEKGTVLIINEIEKNEKQVPASMSWLVYAGTIFTHLFGGSAGREGTAVQMAAGIVSSLSKKLNPETKNILLRCGVASGFGAVFGTPFAGAIFATEFLRKKKWKIKVLVLCVFSAFSSHLICIYSGISHAEYSVPSLQMNSTLIPNFKLDFILLSIVSGFAFGLCAWSYVKLSRIVKDSLTKIFNNSWILPFIGGIAITSIVLSFSLFDYIGLGTHSSRVNGISIENAFHESSMPQYAFLIKLILTILTLSVGFKGGEVTPLFFIGSCFGNALAQLFGFPIDLLAALGFIAVFAGASKTPIASAVLGMELFGLSGVLYFMISTFIANSLSSKKGIYH